jgi:anti-anti-sigma factor
LERRLGGATTDDQALIAPVAAPRSAPQIEDRIDVARLSGEIDLANATTLFHEILAQVRSDSVGLVIDLSEVEFLDSTGVRLLFRVAERLEPRRQGLCLVAPPGSPPFRILRLSGFDSYRQVVPTVTEAMAVVRRITNPSASLSEGPDGLT